VQTLSHHILVVDSGHAARPGCNPPTPPQARVAIAVRCCMDCPSCEQSGSRVQQRSRGGASPGCTAVGMRSQVQHRCRGQSSPCARRCLGRRSSAGPSRRCTQPAIASGCRHWARCRGSPGRRSVAWTALISCIHILGGWTDVSSISVPQTHCSHNGGTCPDPNGRHVRLLVAARTATILAKTRMG